MPLKDQQKQVDGWAQQFKVPYWQPLEQMARLTEEVGELAREINHRYGAKKKKSSEDVKELAEELGDVLFTLMCMANQFDVDLDHVWQEIMDKCYGRDKDRYERK